MNRMTYRIPLAVSLLLGNFHLHAADPTPPEIQVLRQRAQSLAAEGVKQARDAGIQELLALEKARAAAGDTEGAARARALRTGWSESSATTDGRRAINLIPQKTSRSAAGVTPLSAEEGPGGVEMLSSGAMLEWEPAVEPGWYDVRIQHRVAGFNDLSSGITPGPFIKKESTGKRPEAGGYVKFSAIYSQGSRTSTAGRGIVSTGGNWRTVSLGAISLEGKSAILRLEALESGSNTLMDLRGIELVPLAGPTGAAALAPFQTLQKKYREEVSAATKPVNDIYRRELQRMEAAARRSGDQALLARLAEEEEALDGKVRPDGSSARPYVLGIQPSLDFDAGDTRPTAARDALQAFRQGTVLRWKLRSLNISPGNYKVVVSYRTHATCGGTASLQSAGGPPVTLKIPAVEEPGKRKPRSSDGNGNGDSNIKPEAKEATVVLSIPADAASLEFRVTSLIHSSGSLLELQNLTLIRQRD